MKWLVVADLHYSLPQYDWVVGMADRFDLVIVAGDHLDLSSMVDFRAQSIIIRKYIARLREKTRVIVSSGNHDLDSRNPEGEKVAQWITDFAGQGIPADGASFHLDDTLITICPWWDGPIVRDAIAHRIATDAEERPKRWVWVNHAPPAQSPTSWGGSRYFGDVELVGWIETYKPDIVFSGHVHQSPFVKGGSWVDRLGSTWVFNAGHQFGVPPSHIILDTDEGKAYWFSAAGNEYVVLDQPLKRPVDKLVEPPEWLVRADRESQAQRPAETAAAAPSA